MSDANVGSEGTPGTPSLRELAERATRGPWTSVHHFNGIVQVCDANDENAPLATMHQSLGEQDANADFIAAANPAAILALLGEIESTRAFANRWMKAALYATPITTDAFDPTNPEAFAESRRHAVDLLAAKAEALDAARAALREAQEELKPVRRAQQEREAEAKRVATPCRHCGKRLDEHRHSISHGHSRSYARLYCPTGGLKEYAALDAAASETP